MTQHLSSPERRSSIDHNAMRRASSNSIASTTTVAGDNLRRESAPNTGLQAAMPIQQSNNLAVPEMMQTSFSAPTSPMRGQTGEQQNLGRGAAQPKWHPQQQSQYYGYSPLPSPSCHLHPPSDTQPWSQGPGDDASAMMFISGSANRRQSEDVGDLGDFALSSPQHRSAGETVSPPAMHVSSTMALPSMPADVHDGLSDISEQVKAVDLNSTDEGIVVTSPDSSERSSIIGEHFTCLCFIFLVF